LVAVPLLCLVALLAWIFRPRHETLGAAYINEPSVTLWSSVAQVRRQIGEVHYGDRVDLLARRNENAKIRTPAGAVGWVDGHNLMDTALWQRSEALLQKAQTMPVQARGRTKVPTNVRVAAGRREARLYQFSRGVPVEILGRAVADWVQASDERDTTAPAGTKKEDWYLVRGIANRPPGETSPRAGESTTTEPGEQSVPIAGWVIARFVELNLPDPVREGINSANLRPVAWFELNRVHDPSGDKPQFLVAAARGPEGQPCDFTALRVYTWNAHRSRYETAFIENDLCGMLPVRLNKTAAGQPEFRFANTAMGDSSEDRAYALMQTVVRRIREDGEKGAFARERLSRKGTGASRIKP
jgi:hypothetical protein